jgi:hypothetical protein
MKSLSGKLEFVLLVIGLAIFGNAKVWGADWKLIGTTENGMFFYDTGKIARRSKNIIRVRGRIDYSEKAIKDMVLKYGSKFETLHFALDVLEYKCVEKRVRIVQCAYYSKNGTIIKTFVFSKAEWSFVTPGSIEDALFKEVCK